MAEPSITLEVFRYRPEIEQEPTFQLQGCGQGTICQY